MQHSRYQLFLKVSNFSTILIKKIREAIYAGGIHIPAKPKRLEIYPLF
jgi:hypothetical protein